MKKNINNKNRHNVKKGFSLIEVLFSLLVLTAGISAILSLMTLNTKTATSIKNQIIASELAQEGVELVKNLKDTRDSDPTLPLFASEISGDNYKIDFNSDYTTFKNSNSVADSKNLALNSQKIYLHGAATPTKFYRKIAVSVTPDATTWVTSYVSWDGMGIPNPCSLAVKCLSIVSVLRKM